MRQTSSNGIEAIAVAVEGIAALVEIAAGGKLGGDLPQRTLTKSVG